MRNEGKGHFPSVFLGMSKILGIDYGLARCGIAITDENRIIASGLTTVPSKEIWTFLNNTIPKEAVEIVVVGEPHDLMGRDTHATEPANKFCESLVKRFPKVQVVRVDETYTSKMAMEAMVTGGMKKSKRREKGMVDMISATLILQSYLESPNA
jgi:putative Holliday junction resolvase